MSKKFISIGWKISAYVVLITSFLTLTILVSYYYISYDLELNRVDRQQEEIEASHIPVLTKSLWNFESEKIEYQIQGMLAMEHINYLELNSPGELNKYGTPITDGNVLEKSSPLIRPTGDPETIKWRPLALLQGA